MSIACIVLAVALACVISRGQESVVGTRPGAPLQSANNIVVQPVVGEVPKHLFPNQWYCPPVSVHATPISDCEAEWAAGVVREELTRYPQRARDLLERVVLVRTLEFSAVGAGGTNFDKTVVLALLTIRGDCFSASELAGALHHEFSSILLRQFDDRFPRDEWLNCNPPGFEYLGSGVAAVHEGRAALRPNALSMSRGFVCEYGQASLEEDFNVTVQLLFDRDHNLHCLLTDRPRTRQKAKLAAGFLLEIDPGFARELDEILR